MSDLKFVATKDLVKEVMSRFDCFVIGAFRKQTKDESSIYWRFDGDGHLCLGLLERLKYEIVDELTKIGSITESDEI